MAIAFAADLDCNPIHICLGISPIDNVVYG